MGSFFALILIIFSFTSSNPTRSNAQTIKSPRLLDLLIRDYTFKSMDKVYLRTGTSHSVHLPSNYSDIAVDIVKLRCGSLRRYGAKLKEFDMGYGVTIHPCLERVILIRQELGYNWSSIYYSSYDLSGYKLVSPILGLLAYNAGNGINGSESRDPFELGILSGEKPIRVDFTNVTTIGSFNAGEIMPLCASFEGGWKMTLSRPVSKHVCGAKRNAHFGLVVEWSGRSELRKRRISRWKVVVGTTIGAAIGASLVGLLLVAMFVKVKERYRKEEMERRAYEEEALQVSMVGHIRAPTARASSVTRTPTTVEKGYKRSLHF